MSNKNDFIKGFACALVTLNDIYDQPTMCMEVIKSCGFSEKDFKKIDGYDNHKLKKIFKG